VTTRLSASAARSLGLPSGRSKYRSVKTEYSGLMYDSKLEAGLAAELDAKKRARVIIAWRRQVPVELIAHGQKIAKLVFDFEVLTKEGRLEYWEAKGMETPAYKLKLKLFKAMRPDAVVHVVKKGART
jgi:hypothetical protein